MAEDVLWGDLGGEVSPSPLCTFLSPSRGCGEPGWVFALLLSWWVCVCPGHGWHWLREKGPTQVRYLVRWDRTKLDSAATVACPGKAGVRRRSCTVVMLGHSEGSSGGWVHLEHSMSAQNLLGALLALLDSPDSSLHKLWMFQLSCS